MEITMKKNSVLGAKTVLSLFIYLSVAMLLCQCSTATAEESKLKPSEIVGFTTKLIKVSRRGTTSVEDDIQEGFVQPVPTSILKRIARSASSRGSDSSCRSCNLTRRMVVVQKPRCRPAKIIVSACGGGCDTWEIPDVSPRHSEYNHTVCMPQVAVSKKFILKGCPPGVNPSYTITYPKSCTCAPCSSRNMACRTL